MLDLKAGENVARKLDPKLATVESNHPAGSNWLALALVGVMVLATISVFLLDRLEQTQLVRLDADYTQKSADLATAPYPELLTRVQALDQARRSLAAADTSPVIWSGLLRDFQTTTSAGVTLGTVSIDTGGLVTLDGTTDTVTTLAAYLATLRASAFLQAVELVSATATETEGKVQVQFAVGAKLSPTALTRAGQTGGI